MPAVASYNAGQYGSPLFKVSVDALRGACNACHTAEKVGFIHVGIPSIKQTPLVHN